MKRSVRSTTKTAQGTTPLTDTSLEHERDTNVSPETIRELVDRLFNVESEFADVKSEYTATKTDLRTEIKGREDETGVTFKQVESLVKIRLNEQKARDEQEARDADMFLYEKVYGFAPETSSDDEDDPLA